MFCEPPARLRGGSAWHDVEELASAHVDDLRRPRLGAEPAHPCEQGLIQAKRGDITEAVGVIDELLADDHDGVHHGVPAATEFACNIRHRVSVAADLQRRPPGRPCRQRAPSSTDLRVLVTPTAATTGAAPALLAPHQPGRAPEHRQIDHLDVADTVTMHDAAAVAPGSWTRDFDDDSQPSRPVAHTNDVHVGQADEQCAHARSIRFQAGAPQDSMTSTSPRIAGPLRRARDLHDQPIPTLRREAPDMSVIHPPLLAVGDDGAAGVIGGSHEAHYVPEADAS